MRIVMTIRMLTLSKELYSEIVNEIIETFPNERSENFILGHDKDKNTGESVSLGGRLFRHFHYVKGRMRERNVLNRTRRNKSQDPPVINLSDTVHDKLTKLQTNSEGWLITKQLWQETFEIRQELLTKKILSPHQYVESFSCLDVISANELIEEDFVKLYSEESYFNFVNKWCASRNEFFKLFKTTKLKNPSHQLLIEGLENSNPSDKWDAILFMLLPSLIKPYRPRKSINQEHLGLEANGGEKPPQKFSSCERILSFIIHIKDVIYAKDILPTLKNLYNKHISQPVVVLIGSLFAISGAFVVHKNNIYQARSCLEAIGLCFKIYAVCQYKYPASSYPFWIFIQRGFFGITTPNDEISQNLRDLFMYIQTPNEDDQ